MTIEIQEPQLEQRIQQLMDTGGYSSVEDLLQSALRTSPPTTAGQVSKKQNLADFLLNSPLRGSNLKIERSKDEARDPGF